MTDANANEQRLYQLVPHFVEACLAYRRQAPCNLVIEFDVDQSNYADAMHVRMSVSRAGTKESLYVRITPKADGQRPVWMDGDGHTFASQPAVVRLTIMSRAEKVFVLLSAALDTALVDLHKATKGIPWLEKIAEQQLEERQSEGERRADADGVEP